MKLSVYLALINSVNCSFDNTLLRGPKNDVANPDNSKLLEFLGDAFMQSLPFDKETITSDMEMLQGIGELFSQEAEAPELPKVDDIFTALNPFSSKTSFKTKVECGVCRWGTWLARGVLGNPASKELLIGAGRALCPLFIN